MKKLLIKKNCILRIFTVLMVMIMVFGTVPVSAATKTVKVTTKKKLMTELNKSGTETIVFISNSAKSYTLTNVKNSKNKKLIVKAPKAKFVNKTVFKSITLEKCGTFTEKASGNKITIKGTDIVVKVASGKKVSKLTASATKTSIFAAKNAVISDLLCNKKSASINLDVAAGTKIKATLSKKTSLEITGSKKAGVDINSTAKSCTITTSVPVTIDTQADLKLNLAKGSEGSVIDAPKSVSVKINNDSSKTPTIKEDGKVVSESKNTTSDVKDNVSPSPSSTDKSDKTNTGSTGANGSISGEASVGTGNGSTGGSSSGVSGSIDVGGSTGGNIGGSAGGSSGTTSGGVSGGTSGGGYSGGEISGGTSSGNSGSASGNTGSGSVSGGSSSMSSDPIPVQTPDQPSNQGQINDPGQNTNPETSNTPSTNPVTSTSPSVSPVTSTSPSVSPEASASPNPSPEVSTSPSPSLEASTSPSPEASTSPSPSPEASTSPSPSPEASTSPSPSPEASTSPSPSPEASTSPSPSPEASTSPSPSPEVSTSPSPEASTSPSPSPEASTSPSPSPEASTSPSPSATEAPVPTLEGTVTLRFNYGQTEARKMFDKINEFRSTKGKDYIYDYTLEKAAMQRAAEIAVLFDNETDNHLRPDGNGYKMTLSEYGFNVSPRGILYGENIAFSVTENPGDATSGFNLFNSGDQATLLLADFNYVGIGHVRVNKTDYWVMLFSKENNRVTGTPDAPIDGEKDVTLKIPDTLVDTLTADYSSGVSVVEVGSSVSTPVYTAKVKFKNSEAGEIPVVGNVSFESEDDYVKASNGMMTGLKAGLGKISATILGQKIEVNITVNGSSHIQELVNSATTYSNTVLTVNDEDVAKCEEDVVKLLYNKVKNNGVSGPLAVNSFDLLKDEEEYEVLFPSVKEIVFSNAEIFDNASLVNYTITYKENSFFPDERAIDYAIANGNEDYLTTSEKELSSKINNLLINLKGNTDYDTVKNIHDYLVKNIAYTFPQNNQDMSVYSVSGALNKFEAVCDGYAKSFYLLCRASGIEAIYVAGTATNTIGSPEDHAWNKVKIADNWYAIDCTWDDPTPDDPGKTRYDYFLISDTDMSNDHIWDDTDLPKAIASYT